MLTKVSGSLIASETVTNNNISNSAVTSAKIADDAIVSAKIADDAIVSAKIASSTSQLFIPNLGTAVASTSGTSIDFTGIPAYVKRITVMFRGVSTNGSSPPIMKLGTSGGFVSSGYASGGVYVGPTTGNGNRTDSFLISGNAFDSNATIHGHAVLTNISGNSWVQSFVVGQSNSAYASLGGGSITLSGALTQVRITTVNGTDTFDAGSINILFE